MLDYITIYSDSNHLPQKAIQLAKVLSEGFQKEICFLSFAASTSEELQIKKQHQLWMQEGDCTAQSFVQTGDISTLHKSLTKIEAAFLIIELSSKTSSKEIQVHLNTCKPLRIPYFFVKSEITSVKFNRVLVPVGFLTEEKEKGIFASKLARFCNSSITLLKAKDYGSKAERSVNQIQSLFEKLDVQCEIKQAHKDSFKVQHEASLRAGNGDADLIIITSSREYGLDDIFFGPPERKIIKTSAVPVMVLNPRPDLYVLCD
jgi:nucleotide-binding universal stress UspA family protein